MCCCSDMCLHPNHSVSTRQAVSSFSHFRLALLFQVRCLSLSGCQTVCGSGCALCRGGIACLIMIAMRGEHLPQKGPCQTGVPIIQGVNNGPCQTSVPGSSQHPFSLHCTLLAAQLPNACRAVLSESTLAVAPGTTRPEARLRGSAHALLNRQWGYRGQKLGEASHPGPEGQDMWQSVKTQPKAITQSICVRLFSFHQHGLNWAWPIFKRPWLHRLRIFPKCSADLQMPPTNIFVDLMIH